MTATINGNNQVEEQPATYNRNFQVMLIAGLVFVVIVMVYASLFRPLILSRNSGNRSKTRNSACKNKDPMTSLSKGNTSMKKPMNCRKTMNRYCRSC